MSSMGESLLDGERVVMVLIEAPQISNESVFESWQSAAAPVMKAYCPAKPTRRVWDPSDESPMYMFVVTLQEVLELASSNRTVATTACLLTLEKSLRILKRPVTDAAALGMVTGSVED